MVDHLYTFVNLDKTSIMWKALVVLDDPSLSGHKQEFQIKPPN